MDSLLSQVQIMATMNFHLLELLGLNVKISQTKQMEQLLLWKKRNLRGSRANSQQASVHWLREITKAKLSQAEPSLGKLGQVESIGVMAK